MKASRGRVPTHPARLSALHRPSCPPDTCKGGGGRMTRASTSTVRSEPPVLSPHPPETERPVAKVLAALARKLGPQSGGSLQTLGAATDLFTVGLGLMNT